MKKEFISSTKFLMIKEFPSYIKICDEDYVYGFTSFS